MAASGEVGGQLASDVGSEDLDHVTCQPCQEDGELREAVGICTDCKEYLCQRCFDGHRIPKVTRHHRLLDLQQMEGRGIQTGRTDRCTERCSIHEEEIVKYYCANHDQLSCNVCLNLDHRTCTRVQYIPGVAHDLDNNDDYTEADDQLSSALAHSISVNDIHKQNLETFLHSYATACQKVKDFVKELHHAVDHTEKELLNEVADIKSNEIKEINLVTEKCRAAVEGLQSIKQKIDSLQQSKEKCRLFTEMLRAKGDVRSFIGQIREIEKNQTAIKSEIKFEPNMDILDTVNQPRVFGRVVVNGTQSRDTGRETTLETRTLVKTEHEAQDINVKTPDDKADCWVTGSVVLPDDRLVIIDRPNCKVKVLDIIERRVITQLKLPSSPWDIAVISGKQVAITLPKEKKVVFVNTNVDMSEDRTLSMERQCWGIDYRDSKLLVTFISNQTVQVLDLQGHVLHTITTDQQGERIFQNPYYASFGPDSETLYVSSNKSHNIDCVKLDGTVLSSFKDSGLTSPMGVTVDGRGDVYVCAWVSNTIHLLGPDCRKKSVLLTKPEGLNEPYTVSCIENRLFVGMRGCDSIRVYNIVQKIDEMSKAVRYPTKGTGYSSLRRPVSVSILKNNVSDQETNWTQRQRTKSCSSSSNTMKLQTVFV